MTKVEGSAGHPVNHVCLALSKSEYDALDRRLQAAGVDTSARLSRSYGARGWAPQAFYFADPDGNVVEARYYDVPVPGPIRPRRRDESSVGCGRPMCQP